MDQWGMGLEQEDQTQTGRGKRNEGRNTGKTAKIKDHLTSQMEYSTVYWTSVQAHLSFGVSIKKLSVTLICFLSSLYLIFFVCLLV